MLEGSHPCLSFIICSVRIPCLLERLRNLTSVCLDTHHTPPAVAEAWFDWDKRGVTEWAVRYRVHQVKGFEAILMNDHLPKASTGAIGAPTLNV